MQSKKTRTIIPALPGFGRIYEFGWEGMTDEDEQRLIAEGPNENCSPIVSWLMIEWIEEYEHIVPQHDGSKARERIQKQCVELIALAVTDIGLNFSARVESYGCCVPQHILQPNGKIDTGDGVFDWPSYVQEMRRLGRQ